MGILWKARLAGRVCPHRQIPIREVRDDAERCARGLIVGVGCVVDSLAVAAARKGSQVEPSAEIFPEAAAQRMEKPDMMEPGVTVPPSRRVRADRLNRLGQSDLRRCVPIKTIMP
jgi:hypothetical protein